jgi:CRISPR-associated protein Cmr1
MHRVEAEFEIVTPMFLGGADPKAGAELRGASLKGALRFWWRALAWGRLRSLNRIHEDEARIFGSANSGQGRVLLRILESRCQFMEARNQAVLKDAAGEVIRPGARYLGYGLVEAFASRPRSVSAGQLIRPCIREGGRFTIELRLRPLRKDPANSGSGAPVNDPDRDLASVLGALKLLGLIGGLGARTRRGWGSLALKKLKVDREVLRPPASAEEYESEIRELVGASRLTPAPPPYTAFFEKARVLILKEGNTALDVLDDLGDTFQLYRGWRHPSEAPEQNFAHDHHGKARGSWSIPAESFERGYPSVTQNHPLRVEFGLPHNYDQRLNIEAEGHDRRASPLLFHIHPVGDKYCAVATFLPTPFLPSRPAGGPRKIRIKRKIGSGWVNADVDNRVDYGVIQRFLFGFTPPGSSTKRDYFDGTRRVIL